MKHLKKQAMQGLATVSASVLVLSMGVENACKQQSTVYQTVDWERPITR